MPKKLERNATLFIQNRNIILKYVIWVGYHEADGKSYLLS